MNTDQFVSDGRGRYVVNGTVSSSSIVKQAESILFQACRDRGPVMSCPEVVTRWLRLHLHGLKHEVFGVLLLDRGHHVIDAVDLFHGDVSECKVYVRQVLKVVIRFGAADVICYHNHPGGESKPSKADIAFTRRCSDALALIEVQLIDHLIVGGSAVASLAALGLISERCPDVG